MFEKNLKKLTAAFYAGLAGAGILWLGWLCFGHFPFWLAAGIFILLFLVAAALFAPVLAVIAAAAGLLSAVILRLCGKWISPGYADVLRRRFSRSATSSQNQ